MYKVIEGLPENTVGFEISGKLTHEDYVDGMLPLCDDLLKKHKQGKMLVVMTEDFSGMELSAMWDDMTYGLKHWHDLSHIALATDVGWMRNIAAVVKPFFPAEVKLFKLAEAEQAKSWIAAPEQEMAA